MGLIDTVFTYDVAVYWSPLGLDSFGQRTYNAPVEIQCRWSEKNDRVIDSHGEEALSRAMVIVGQDVVPGGVLLHSELDSSVDDTPSNNTGAWEIIRFDKIPNKRNTKYLRKAYL